MATFAAFLRKRDFFLPDDEDDYWPDESFDPYRGITFGASCPNDGALTVEILVDGRWHVRDMEEEEDDDWDYSLDSVCKYAHAVIDEWMANSEG
ncbi:hypothetical protein [Medusavirus stheno T3]|uniref:Uncharacterized protein n=1 Tax=Medusavirus stheno T3 TaxID=3069717 RepID=A0A7S7YEJ3_9VIRU|nr:hypothetical protein QKU73_gp147 [Acanthamoeba castellanii medusavirus]QPB44328.1 hypothetical protein [Medusavirus stheno T3]